ncbi:MAG: PEP-CTERM sorting domain-containing protein [Syntrophales bacterium]|jgi:hypothetical protein
MLSIYKRILVILIFAFLSLGLTNGLAYGTLINLDAREDAGLYPGQPAYLNFLSNGIEYPGPATDPGWTHYTPDFPGDPRSVDTYAYNASIPGSWVLQSAGNVWSSDKVVGESLTALPAGTYRISPASGAFMYSFSDNPPYNRFWWELQIEVKEGSTESYYMLGSYDSQDSASAAFDAVKNEDIYISIAQGGSLSFWIWDWNSIDNSGSLAFNVAVVPEPSTFLLLTMGLAFLIRRIRS